MQTFAQSWDAQVARIAFRSFFEDRPLLDPIDGKPIDGSTLINPSIFSHEDDQLGPLLVRRLIQHAKSRHGQN